MEGERQLLDDCESLNQQRELFSLYVAFSKTFRGNAVGRPTLKSTPLATAPSTQEAGMIYKKNVGA